MPIVITVATAAAAVAHDEFGHMSGWGWGWMIGGWLMFLGAAALIAWAFRSSGSMRRGDAPEDILAERFARGEISREEYDERLSVLRKYG